MGWWVGLKVNMLTDAYGVVGEWVIKILKCLPKVYGEHSWVGLDYLMMQTSVVNGWLRLSDLALSCNTIIYYMKGHETFENQNVFMIAGFIGSIIMLKVDG